MRMKKKKVLTDEQRAILKALADPSESAAGDKAVLVVKI